MGEGVEVPPRLDVEPQHDSEGLWDLELLASARRLGDWMFEQFAPYARGNAVEVGAGIGTFSERLLAAGVRDLLAIEPEPACARRLRELFEGDARVELSADELPDSPDLLAREGTADLVVCQNVLEHIEDDYAAVAAMAQALAPGGHLNLLVPAHPRLYGALDAAYGHHRRYTRARLRSLIAATGLREVDLYSFNLLGVPGWWVSTLRRRESLSPGPIRAYEALLRLWQPLEGHLRPPWGLSLIIHAVKP
jgi:SAM-dependent methyltransferase